MRERRTAGHKAGAPLRNNIGRRPCERLRHNALMQWHGGREGGMQAHWLLLLKIAMHVRASTRLPGATAPPAAVGRWQRVRPQQSGWGWVLRLSSAHSAWELLAAAKLAPLALTACRWRAPSRTRRRRPCLQRGGSSSSSSGWGAGPPGRQRPRQSAAGQAARAAAAGLTAADTHADHATQRALRRWGVGGRRKV